MAEAVLWHGSDGLLKPTSAALPLPVDITAATGASVKITDGVFTATIRDLAVNDALNVAIVDAAGAQVTSFGGGTQYADAAARGTATGTLLMVDDGTLIQSALGTSAGVLKVDVSATTANATAIKTDGSAVTQPVSGTVTAAQTTATSLKAEVIGAGVAGTANAGVLTIQGIAAMTKLLVTPDSVALPANQSVNVAQINGVTPLMGTGIMGTGSPRVTIASDNDALTVKQGTAANLKTAATLDAETTKVIGTVNPGNTANTTAWMVGHGKTLLSKTGSASATFTIVAAVASNKIKVYSLSLITASTTAVTVTFKDGAGGTALATYPLQAITATNFGIAENVAVPSSLFEGSVNTLLEMAFSAAQTVTYNLRYWSTDTV